MRNTSKRGDLFDQNNNRLPSIPSNTSSSVRSNRIEESSMWNTMYNICILCLMEAIKLLRGLEKGQQQQQQERMLQMKEEQLSQRSNHVSSQNNNERTFVSVTRTTTIKLNPSVVKSVRSARLVSQGHLARNGSNSPSNSNPTLSSGKPRIHFHIKSPRCQCVLRRLPNVYRSRRRRSQPFVNKLAVIKEEETWSDLE